MARSTQQQRVALQQLLKLCSGSGLAWQRPAGEAAASASSRAASLLLASGRAAPSWAQTSSFCSSSSSGGGSSSTAGAALRLLLATGRNAAASAAVARTASHPSTFAAACFASSTIAARAPPSLARRARSLLHDYRLLSKAKLSALVALTASAGYLAGSGDAVDWAGLAWTSLGTFGAAAAANALNQAYEVANDARMSRTRNRPLPAGRMSRAHALAFAAAAGAAGLWLLATQTNELTTALGAANILLYAGVYTPLKQLTVANTWVGALVGAVPPLMGWAAAAGGGADGRGTLEPGAWLLAGALFSWQMPHFMALAWLCKDDYARGGFRMLSSIDATGRRTAAVALRHCVFLLPAGALAAALAVTSPSPWFAAEAAVLAAMMGASAARFHAAPSQATARALFRRSLIYLPALLACLAIHREPNAHLDWAALAERARERWGVVIPPSFAALSWPELRLRPFDERVAGVLAMRCPSRVYADEASGGDGGEGEDEAKEAGANVAEEEEAARRWLPWRRRRARE